MISEHHLYNPFLLETASDDELSEAINIIASKLRPGETPNDISQNIILEADLLTIYGEFVARYQFDYDLTKLEADNTVANIVCKLRDECEEQGKKAPAISYFEKKAEITVKDLRKKQIRLDGQLTRFKRAYSSMETKQNALKKKLDAMRYEMV